MKLLVISHTPHYVKGGDVVGWGPTVRELNHLAGLFEQVIHLAPLHREQAPESALPYETTRLVFRPLPPAGGKRFVDKLGVLFVTPLYLRAMLKALSEVDAVHVRCPANISLLAVLLLAIVRKPRIRWIKYAGNWRPSGRESWSYTFQRWLLNKNLPRSVVTVNGDWPGQPKHIRSFLNPCLSEQELIAGRAAAAGKELTSPIRLMYAGRLEVEKGVGRAIEVLSQLRRRGVEATLDVVGDGAERDSFERLAVGRGLSEFVVFHGWLARAALNPLFAQAHFLLFPAESSEGWPKVLSEAMAYGAVPLAGNISSIPQLLNKFRSGRVCPAGDEAAFVEVLVDYKRRPEVWRVESANGIRAAHLFSYANYLNAVRDLLHMSVEDKAAVYVENKVSPIKTL